MTGDSGMESEANHLLLVEDDDRSARLETEILEKLPYRVIRVSNGESAIDIVKTNHEIVLILIDTDLGPGINGPTTAKAILRLREIPIIFLSGQTDSETIDLTEEISAYGYLHKSATSSVYASFINNSMRLFRTNQEIRQKNDILASKIRQFDTLIDNTPAAVAVFDDTMHYLSVSKQFIIDYKIKDPNVTGKSHYEVFPEITNRVKEIHQRCLHGEILSDRFASFYRVDGTFDFVKWEMRPWYTGKGEIGGVILFSIVLSKFIEEYKQYQASELFHISPEQK
jgi:FOG: CheY-like receiver